MSKAPGPDFNILVLANQTDVTAVAGYSACDFDLV